MRTGGERGTKPHLHGRDILEQVLDVSAGAAVAARGVVQGEQGEETAAVRLIAVDLGGRAAAGRWAVEQGAQRGDWKGCEEQPASPENPSRAEP